MLMEKNIRKSRRGLTFSFQPTKTLGIGSRYDYIIDKLGNICIVPTESGSHKVSRKKRGTHWIPLIDLRNREVLDAIAHMDSIQVSINGDSIQISAAEVKKKAIILEIPRQQLQILRMAAGMEDVSSVDCLLGAAQISFDEYLASCGSPASISTIQKDLGPVRKFCVKGDKL